MRVCKWAGDAGDEYCVNCDGIKMMVEGNEVSCEECAGYEAGDEEVEVEQEVKEETVEELPINKPEAEEPKEEPAKKSNKKPNNTVKEEKVSKTTPKEEKAVKSANKAVKTEIIAEENPAGVNVVALRYMSGVTVCHKDAYYKLSAEEEWLVDINIINTPQKLEDIRERLWAKLNSQVDKQVEDVLKN